MKAVIFSCSLKNPKWSSTYAWCRLMAKRLGLKGIKTQVVALKDYDYECSVGKDELHEQLKYVYDASLIMFASPNNIFQPTWSCTNLIDRFVHAHKQSKEDDIDIFKNKIWEYCEFQNGENYGKDGKGRPSARPYYKGNETMLGARNNNKTKGEPHWQYHHGYMIKTLTPFMKWLGLPDTYVATAGPPDGMNFPDYKNMGHREEVIRMCDDIVETFIRKSRSIDDVTPKCSLNKFLEYFKSDDPNAFGRGITMKMEDINEQSVRHNIKHVHRRMTNEDQKAMVFISMKERCQRLGANDLAELYYIEHFKIHRAQPEHKLLCSGNYRPNGY